MEQPISRGEFNAAMHGMRESIDGLKEGVTRVEAKQDMASTQALDTAREAGRTDARLEALEAAQRDDRGRIEKLDYKVWGLIILALGILGKFAIGLLAVGVR